MTVKWKTPVPLEPNTETLAECLPISEYTPPEEIKVQYAGHLINGVLMPLDHSTYDEERGEL